jgi:membrane protease YdiL (CAAX protease family)
VLQPAPILVVAAPGKGVQSALVILLTHFAMGLLFGWVFRRSQSLYAGMALHAPWNFLVLCLELAG